MLEAFLHACFLPPHLGAGPRRSSNWSPASRQRPQQPPRRARVPVSLHEQLQERGGSYCSFGWSKTIPGSWLHLRNVFLMTRPSGPSLPQPSY